MFLLNIEDLDYDFFPSDIYAVIIVYFYFYPILT